MRGKKKPMPLPNPKSGVSAGFVYFGEKKALLYQKNILKRKENLYTIVILLVVKSPPFGVYMDVLNRLKFRIKSGNYFWSIF